MGVTFTFRHLRGIFEELEALFPLLSMSFKVRPHKSQSIKYAEKGYKENVYSLYMGLYEK